MEVKENGFVRRITKLEAAAKQLANRAAKGEDRAVKFLFDLLETYEGRRVEADADRLGEADEAVIADLVRRIGPLRREGATFSRGRGEGEHH